MLRKTAVLPALLAIITAWILATACIPLDGARVGDLHTETRTVEQDGAGTVDVEIQMGAGVLHVSGGASDLLEASFAYNVEELEPHITYAGNRLVIDDNGATASIASLFEIDEFRNDWALKFDEDVPLDMELHLGAGPANLALGDLALTGLRVDGGAGTVTIDLTGDWQEGLDATIAGGIGPLALILPHNIGVRIDVEPGLGSVNASGLSRDGNTYTNDAFGQSEIALHIEIEGGAGTIRLDVR